MNVIPAEATMPTEEHPASAPTVALTRAAETGLEVAGQDFSTRSASLALEIVFFEAQDAIHDETSHELASALRNKADDLRKEIVAFYKQHKADANRVHKNACEAERQQLGAAELAKKQMGDHLVRWRQIVALEEQQRFAETERKALESAQKVLDARVEALGRAGLLEESEIASTAPLDVILPEAPGAPPAPEGTTFTDTYVAVLEDIDLVPSSFKIVTFDQKFADLHLKETNGQVEILGCRIEVRSVPRRTK